MSFRLRCVLGACVATGVVAVATGWVGSASPPYFQVNPPNKAFGDVAIGSAASQSFTVTNAGGRQTGILQASISGAGAAEYALSLDSCSGRRLRPGESCTLTVVFAPALVGVAYAQVNITADNPPGGYVAWLSGRGV
jgi:hypothetical protein